MVVWDVVNRLAATSTPWRKKGLLKRQLEAEMGTQGLTFTSSFPLLHRWIEVFIPKISISTSYDLETILPKMGIQDAFDQNADFSGITKKGFLQVSKVSWSMRVFA